MLELAFKILGYWFAASFLTLPFVLALLKANGPDREPIPVRPRIVAVNGRRIGDQQ